MKRHGWILIVGIVVGCGGRTSLDLPAITGSNDSGADTITDAHADGGTSGVPCDATKIQVLATNHFTASQIAVDDSFVYWAEADAIRRVSKQSGGTPEILGARINTPWPLMQVFALDATHVYFAAEALVRVDKLGGTPVPLGLETTAALVALDGSTLLAWEWLGDGSLSRLPTNGGTSMLITQQLPPDTNTLIAEGNMAYGSSEKYGTFAVDLVAGAVKRLDATESFNLAIDDTYVYFTTGKHGPIGSNAVMRVAKVGGVAEQVVTASYAFSLALDGDTLFYTDDLTGQILHVNKNGGPATVFETNGAETPFGITLDERCVYWTSNTGKVMVAPK